MKSIKPCPYTKNPDPVVNFCLFVYADPNHALPLPSCRKKWMLPIKSIKPCPYTGVVGYSREGFYRINACSLHDLWTPPPLLPEPLTL